jgi:hypothetical protein
MKNQFKLRLITLQELKVGDIVRVYDGSSITSEKDDKAIFIVHSYPELTGLNNELKDINAEVLKVGIDDLFCFGCHGFRDDPSSIYRQDIQIKIGNGIFYTNSSMVYKVEQTSNN